MKDCATDDNNFTYKPVNHEIYQKIKKDRRARYSKTYRENARKRKNGEYVVKQKGGAVPKLAASERSNSGFRACNDCSKNIQIRDGLGGGYCATCAPASLRKKLQCSHQGCTNLKRYEGKCLEHCDPNNEQYIAQKQRKKLMEKKRRAAEKK